MQADMNNINKKKMQWQYVFFSWLFLEWKVHKQNMQIWYVKFKNNWNMILIIFFFWMQEWYALTKADWYEICNKKKLTNNKCKLFSRFGMQKPKRETIL